jgi:DNA polymerase-1
MEREKTLVLVDGSALAFRSFFALLTAGMRTVDGTPTWAVYGFFMALFELIEKRCPDMMAVCFDLSAPTFRHTEFKDYKATRKEMPDDLAVQWPLIKQGVEKLGIPIYELPGYEADDVIGTVAKHTAGKDMKVLILTGDQDAFQLVDEEGNIQVLMTVARDGLATYGRQQVFEKLGVWPEQVPDYKGLCGDTSDNIPGVRGIGPKTAVQLLTQYQTVEGIYENLDAISSKSVKQKLTDGRDSAFQSKDLARIRLDVPIDLDFENCRLRMPEIQPVIEFCREMEFNAFLKRLPKILSCFNNGVAPQLDEELLKPVMRQSKASRVPVLAGAVSAQAVETAPEVTEERAWSGQLSIFSAPTAAPKTVQPVIVRTKDQLDWLLKELSQQSAVALELETTRHSSLDNSIVGYALAWTSSLRSSGDGKLEIASGDGAITTAYVPVRHFGGEEQLSPDYVSAALKESLESKSLGKIAHNAKFEMNSLSLDGISFGPLVFDPMVASYIVNTEDGHGLKDQAERLLGYAMVEISDITGTKKKQINVDEVPVEKAALRSADHAMVALELAKYYIPRMDDQQKFLMWEMDLPLEAVLARMEQAGLALDLPYLANFSEELARELERLEKEIHELAGHPFNIGSTQQLQKVLFDELKLPAKTKTKSGFSTDASVLEGLAKEHPIVRKILEYRHDLKLRSTYVEALPKLVSPRDGRLHGEFLQTSTSTGRLSSTNPNLQNIPIRTELGRRIRRAIIPGNPDNVLLSADYSQIELRMLAHMCGDEILIDAFESNQDIHARTAAEIFEVPIDEVSSDHRRVGKTLNFALIYQQGAYSTAQNLGISPKEAQGFIDKYFARYPKVRNFLTGSIQESRRNGFAATIWGRRRYFRHLNDRNDVLRRAEERAACNAPIQGSAADLMKLAMIRLDTELAQRNLSGKLILQVHDELVLEVPKSEVDQTKEAVRAAMSGVGALTVPLQVDIGVGINWMETK